MSKITTITNKYLDYDEYKKLQERLVGHLGVLDAFVLLQLVAEFHHAEDNNFNMDNYFLMNIPRFSDSLGLNTDETIESLSFLSDIDLIDIWETGIENTELIEIKKDMILNYYPNFDYKILEPNWDKDLIKCQNPKIEDTSFHKSVYKIIEYIHGHLKNHEIIPMALYAFCHKEFLYYEIGDEDEEKRITDDMLDFNRIYMCLIKPDFNPMDIANYVKELCEHLEKEWEEKHGY